MEKHIKKAPSANEAQSFSTSNMRSYTISSKNHNNSLSNWNLNVKFVFQMIDETNSIPQLYNMVQECREEGRPHIIAYIDNRIDTLKERLRYV